MVVAMSRSAPIAFGKIDAIVMVGVAKIARAIEAVHVQRTENQPTHQGQHEDRMKARRNATVIGSHNGNLP